MDFDVLGIKITQFEWGNDLVILDIFCGRDAI